MLNPLVATFVHYCKFHDMLAIPADIMSLDSSLAVITSKLKPISENLCKY